MPAKSLPIVLTALAVLAGCLAGVPSTPHPGAAAVQVRERGHGPIPYAQVSLLAGDRVVALLNADGQGALEGLQVPAGATKVAIGAPGFATASFAVGALPAVVELDRATDRTAGAFLRMLPRVDLACPAIDPPPYSCGRFGESVVEVAGDGTIWESATNAVGRSPPIWTSRDHGKTFQVLSSFSAATPEGLARDATGIEGDFAIDDVGNVYFYDILVGAAYMSSYKADGTHRWTVPEPFMPLNDRPWVRAGKADEVFAAYNTGSATQFYKSTDGGKTFDLVHGHTFACGLGTLGQGPARDQLYVAAACGDKPMLWSSKDGGATWDEGKTLPLPTGTFKDNAGQDHRNIGNFLPPVADEAGNVYVVFSHALERPKDLGSQGLDNETAIYVDRLGPSGAWAGPWQVGPSGLNLLPWPAAGKAGHLGLAWYHADGAAEVAGTTEWRLFTAASVDADAATPHFQFTVADPEVLNVGPLDRNLGDFLQSDLTPDGRLVVAYAKQVGRHDAFAAASSLSDDIKFVQSDRGLDLAPLKFLNGPASH